MLKIVNHLRQKVLFLVTVLLTVGMTLFVTPAANAATCYSQEWGYGNAGSCVKDIQGLLNGAGSYLKYSGHSTLTLDGDFGALTQGQTEDFQSYTGLKKDGIVGPNTWKELCAEDYIIWTINGNGSIITYGKAAGCPGY
jgi:peptidoglycan hydrolase-like protein with peptidoglycan-binding domain